MKTYFNLIFMFVGIGVSAQAKVNCPGRQIPVMRNGEVVGSKCDGFKELNSVVDNSATINTIYSEIYPKLELSSQDTIIKVNKVDFTDPTVFQSFVTGFNAGKLCVKFRRQEQLHRNCYSRSGKKERLSQELL